MTRTNHRNRTLVLTGGVLACVGGPAFAQHHLRVVALTGDPAPNQPGLTIGSFLFGATLARPVINDSGGVLYPAILAGEFVSVSNDNVLLRSVQGTTDLLAREASPIAGVDVVDLFTEQPVLAADGTAAFVTSLRTTGELGLWWAPPGEEPQEFLRSGAPAPTVPGAVIDTLDGPAMDRNGRLAVYAPLRPGVGPVLGTNADAVWIGTPDHAALFAREDDTPPDLFGTGVYQSFDALVGLGEIGGAMINARLRQTGSTTNDEGLWIGNPGNIDLDLLASDTAPGAGTARFQGFSSAVTNGRGGFACIADLVQTDPSVNSGNNRGVWATDADGHTLTLLLREGSPAPGFSEGQLAASPGGLPQMAANGALAVQSSLSIGVGGVTGDTNTVLWARVHETAPLTVIAREGDPAPGTDAFFDLLPSFAINARGEVVFVATLRGGSTNTSNNRGLWIARPGQPAELLIRYRDPFDTNPDPAGETLRTVTQFLFQGGSGNADGRGSGLNDAGQIVVSLSFVGGSGGVFVLSPPMTACEPDLDANGATDIFDVLAYLERFETLGPGSDYDLNGVVNVFDLIAFLDAFTTPCP